MTSIKPPDGRSPAGPIGTAGAGVPLDAPERSGGPSFREVLTGATSADNPTASAQAAQGADPIAQLAESVRSGALSAEQALEQLIDRSIASMQHTLSPAQRDELSQVLRAALEGDPALRELRAALE